MTDEEAEFERALQRKGVEKLPSDATRQAPKGKQAPAKQGQAAHPITAVIAPLDPKLVAAREEIKRLLLEIAQLQTGIASLQARQASEIELLQSDLAHNERDLLRVTAELTARAKQLVATQAESKGLQQRESQHEIRRKELEKALGAADKSALWQQRGIVGQALQVLALQALLGKSPQQTLAALNAADPSGMTKLLHEVAVTCGAPACTVDADKAVVVVPRADCEICAGSDIAQNYAIFAKACADKGILQVTVVGGNPAYREKLRKLSKDAAIKLTLDTLDNGGSDLAKKAKQVRGLVVIWGGSELDHATSNQFKDTAARKIDVGHRGISRMLRDAAAMLSKL